MLSSPLGRTQSKDVRRGMTSPPLDSTHGQTTFGVTYHHRLWTAHTVEQRRAWHAIITFGQHTRSNYVGRGMPSSPLSSTNGRTTSGVACHHLLLAAHTIERRRAWHAIIAHGRQTRSNDIRHDMTSPPLDSTHGRTTLGMAFHHRPWTGNMVERFRAWHAINAFGQHTRSDDVGRGMSSPPFDNTHGRTTSGMTYHHHL